MRTHTHTHPKAKSCKTQLLPSAPRYLRNLSIVQANPPGAGLVTHRRAVQVSHTERSPKFHNDPSTAKQDKDSWAFAYPVNTNTHTIFHLPKHFISFTGVSVQYYHYFCSPPCSTTTAPCGHCSSNLLHHRSRTTNSFRGTL